MSQFKIVFRGRTLPGHDRELARNRLVAALGAGPDVAERLFSGAKATLKAGLDATQAEHYRTKLAGIGIDVEIEPFAPTPAPAPTVAPAPSVPPQAPDQAQVEPVAPQGAPDQSMTCPKCGHRQPPRTLCLACGVDMPRFAALRDQPVAVSPMQEAIGRDAVASAVLAGADQRDPSPPLLGFGLGGRMGRLGYMAGFLLLSCLSFWGVMLAVAYGNTFIAGVLLIALVVPYLRLLILRCHDLDWSGWWVLLSLVPIVGMVFSLVLLAVRGTPDDNRFGPPVESAGWGKLFACLGAYIGLGIIVLPLTQDRMRTDLEHRFGSAADAGNRSLLGNYSPARDEIFLFTRDDCTPCDRRRNEFDRLGIRYIELSLDNDDELAQLLGSRLDLAEHRGSRSLPMVEVNGTLLAGDPSLGLISSHFDGR